MGGFSTYGTGERADGSKSRYGGESNRFGGVLHTQPGAQDTIIRRLSYDLKLPFYKE